MSTSGVETLLQWNMGFVDEKTKPETKASRLEVLRNLVAQHSPSLLVLQEAAPLNDIRQRLPSDYQVESSTRQLVTGFSKNLWNKARMSEVSERAFAVALNHVRGRKIWLWNLHLPTLWKSSEQKREFVSLHVRPAIERVRALDSARLEMIVGDFNLPPYDQIIVMRNGLCANRSLAWVREQQRQTDVVARPLYNPTWGLFGAMDSPCGTFYRSDLDVDGPWYVVDQVLMSCELAAGSGSLVRAIDRAGNIELCSKGPLRCPKKAVGSDHLPICVQFATS